MDPFGADIVATTRRENYLREAAAERPLRQARQERERATTDGTQPARRRRGATRPAIA
jgi:hypothetical protein